MNDDVVSEITARWRVRYEVSRQIQPVTIAPTAPDIRSNFLKLRGEMLKKERRLGAAPTVEEELADTIDELVEMREKNKKLRGDVETLNDMNRSMQEKAVSDQKTIMQYHSDVQKLKTELQEKNDKIEKLQKEEQQLKNKFQAINSATGSMGSGSNAFHYPHPNAAAGGSNSPGRASFRSPARISARGTSPKMRKAVEGVTKARVAVAEQQGSSPMVQPPPPSTQSQSPMRRPAFK